MAMIDDSSREQIKKIFEPLKSKVKVLVVTQKDNCDSCEDTKNFTKEMTDISDKLVFEMIDISDEKAKKLNVEMVPAVILLGEDDKDYGIKFYGIPAGHEINSFIMGLLEVSGAGEKLPDEMTDRINKINKPINIKVFVTLSCPHCAGAVAKAHKLAFMNKNINDEIIEANTFGELSQKFNVSGVPKIVFNDDTELMGDQPIDAFLNTLESV